MQAFSNVEARSIIDTQSLDCVLLAEDLGDRTGLALARDLHASKRTVELPLLYLTSHVRSDEVGLFAAQLLKPVDTVQLLATLSHVMHPDAVDSLEGGGKVVEMKPHRSHGGTR